MRAWLHLCGGVMAMTATACTGEWPGALSTSPALKAERPDPPGARDYFAANVQPALDYCRTCHIPGGTADADDGRLFMLAEQDTSADYDNVSLAWQALDEGVDSNRILLKASGQDPQSHSGGSPWTTDSEPYRHMRRILGCWQNPDDCGAWLAGSKDS